MEKLVSDFSQQAKIGWLMDFLIAAIDAVMRRQEKGGRMRRYKHKENVVIAERWLGTNESEKAIKALGVLVEINPKNQQMYFGGSFGVEILSLGDWVVLMAGRFTAWTHEDFKNQFEPIVEG
jgi:hypothetical protein